MREIKFRAWDKHYQIYIDVGSMFINVETGNPGYDTKDGWSDQSRDVVLEQFTGLKDKNGKEIFEGDVVLVDERGNELVQWNDEGTGFYPFVWHIRNAGEPPLYEVIGNIHENPELLK